MKLYVSKFEYNKINSDHLLTHAKACDDEALGSEMESVVGDHLN